MEKTFLDTDIVVSEKLKIVVEYSAIKQVVPDEDLRLAFTSELISYNDNKYNDGGVLEDEQS